MKVVIAIPARIGSTRLPAKALAEIGGEPMIVRVWRRCSRMRGAAAVLVATDDERIGAAVRAAGGVAVLTSPRHLSGSDRIAEAVRGLGCDLVVNVQGDEPFVEPEPLEALVAACAGDPGIDAATLATPIRDFDELDNPAVVKVLVGSDGYAIGFSRRPLLLRESPVGGASPASPAAPPAACGNLRHIGIYAYRPAFLQLFTALAPTPGELSERLEQLRILEHGHRIRVVETPWESLAVDTPEDLARARERAAREDRA